MKITNIELDTTFTSNHNCYYSKFEGVVITLEDGKDFKFGISTYQECCESWGYLHSSDDVSDFLGAEFLSWEEVDTWPSSIENPEEKYGFDSGGFQAINVLTSKGILQFVVYNAHNGYYSHVTIIVEGETTKESGV